MGGDLRIASFFLSAVLLLLPGSLPAASFFQWTDHKGVTHLTDDPDKIPERYRKKAKEIDIADHSPAVRGPQPQSAPAGRPAPRAPGSPAGVEEAGGHPESWWRERFAALRGELKVLEEGLPAKEEQSAELRRKRVLFSRPQDREAQNQLNESLSADRLRIDKLRLELTELEAQAQRSGVPAEWRQ